MYVFLLAWRYFYSRIVNYVAVLAVALCVMVWLVVMGVLDGVLVDMQKRIRSHGEHVSLSFGLDMATLKEFERAQAALRKLPEVLGVTPVISGEGVVEGAGFRIPVIVYAIDLQREIRFSGLPEQVQGRKLDRSSPVWAAADINPGKRPGMIMGKAAAQRLGIQIGDEVSLGGIPHGGNKIKRKRFVVGNLFKSGNYVRDSYYVFIPLREAQDLYVHPALTVGGSTRVQLFSVWLKDPQQAASLEATIAQVVRQALPDIRFNSDNWQRRWQRESQAMVHENMLQEIIMVLMNLSGGFCVFAILFTLVSLRVRDIGLLRCIGCERSRVVFVFMLVGFIIGLGGALLGVAGGYFLTADIDPRLGPRIAVWYNFFTGGVMFPPHLFEVEKLPIHRDGLKVLIYAASAVVISTLAAVYPAVWAGRRQPVEALRDG